MAATPSSASPAPRAGADCWVERVGPQSYLGHNAAGASVLITSPATEQSFTPGELLKLALGGCAGLTADAALTRQLGPQVSATITVSGHHHGGEDRYDELDQRLLVELSSLSEKQRQRLARMVDLVLGKACTVGLTLSHGAVVKTVVEETQGLASTHSGGS